MVVSVDFMMSLVFYRYAIVTQNLHVPSLTKHDLDIIRDVIQQSVNGALLQDISVSLQGFVAVYSLGSCRIHSFIIS